MVGKSSGTIADDGWGVAGPGEVKMWILFKRHNNVFSCQRH
jgi:hypothetical protein